MISFVSRGLLLSLGLVLAFAVATPARAGGLLWTGTICMDPADASAAFDGSFAGADKCEAICKLAAGACKVAVKTALSCQKSTVGGVFKAFATGCDALEAPDKQECKAMLKQQKISFAEDLASQKVEALGNCASFLESCIMGCSAPPI